MRTGLQILLALTLCSLCPGQQPVASLGGIELSIEDLRDSILSLSEAQVASLRADPGLLEQVARTSLVQKLILQEATDKKWPQQPQVRAMILRAEHSVITESYLQNLLQAPADFPSEAEIKAAYQTAQSSLRVPRSLRLAQIYVASDESKLHELQQRLLAADANFAELASQYSEEATSASRGGELGWLTVDQIQPELLGGIDSLRLHEISKPIKLKDGWHILKLLDARAPYTPTLQQARAQLVRQLRQDELRRRSQAHIAELLRRHVLRLDPKALAKALPSQSSAPSSP